MRRVQHYITRYTYMYVSTNQRVAHVYMYDIAYMCMCVHEQKTVHVHAYVSAVLSGVTSEHLM